MYTEDDYLMISGLQHYYFCKRQWGLIHISQAWADNGLTSAGNILHEKADNPFITETRKNVFISRAMAVSSKTLGFSGILDVVEFKQNENGIAIPGREGKWLPNIVEYKHGKPKKNKCDLMQLTAQVICLEEMLGCSIKSADLFYAATNSRYTVAMEQPLRQELILLAEELHTMFKSAIIPKAETNHNCKKSSLYDICMPKITKKQLNIDHYIAKYLEDENA